MTPSRPKPPPTTSVPPAASSEVPISERIDVGRAVSSLPPALPDLVGAAAAADLSSGPKAAVLPVLDILSRAMPGWSFEVTRLSGALVARAPERPAGTPSFSGALALGSSGMLAYTACTPGLPSELDDATLRLAGSLLTVLLTQAERVEADLRLLEVGRAAAAYAHDLAGPLTAVSTYARALGGRIEPSDADLADRLVSAAGRAEAMSRNLLAYLRGPARTVEPVSLSSVVEAAIRAADVAIADGRATIEVAVDEGMKPVLGVADDLVAVVVNLLSNAVQALPRDGGRIRVETLDESGDALLVVGDSGHGLAEQDGDRIFQPFFTTKSSEKGSGLGLSIVLRIVEQHGGTIDVGTSPLGGAEFVVRLPRRRA